MARSVSGFGVSVSVAVLLPGVGSVWPAPTVTVAVLTRLPIVAALIVPLTVMVSEFAAPAAMLTLVNERALPAEPFVPQLAEPLATQVIVVPVIDAGIVSATETPVAFDGPLLLTTIV